MHKKKIQTLIAAGVLSVGIIGGTLAWFTSQDSLTNIFNTGSVTDPDDGLNAGIDVEENFPGSKPNPDGSGSNIYEKPVLPGDNMQKQVWIESKANYDQILRAKVVKQFIEPTTKKPVTHWAKGDNGEIVYGDSTLSEGTKLDLSKIILKKDTFSSLWDTTSEDGWAYYKTVLKPHDGESHGTSPNFTGAEWGVAGDKCRTDKILDNVTLDSTAGNEYKNLRFDVQIVSESIQATGGAVSDAWKTAPDAIKALDKNTQKPSQPQVNN